jgi:membrane-associated protease RseP (regulator of RpoE activity)
MLTGILIFVAGIFLMIFVHELGHFLTAKRFGIKVEEFFIGFGPRVWSFRRGETEYGLKAVPLGGYVRIAGMNPLEEPSPEDRDRVFTAKPKWQRAIVLVAGGVSHFVMALVVLLAYLWFVGVAIYGGAQVAAVVPELDGQPSPAAVAGLRAGDRLLELDGDPVDSVDEFAAYLDGHVDEPITFVVERDSRRVTTTATPVLSEVEGERSARVGIIVQPALVGRDRQGPVEGVVTAVRGIGQFVGASFESLGRAFGPEGIGRVVTALFGERVRTPEDPVGIVGAARFSGQAVASGQIDIVFQLFAFFNVFVGILNLLPLPPLDGGHLAVLGVEAVTRRRVDQRRLIPITALVAGFLILFTVSLLFLDITEPIPNPFG